MATPINQRPRAKTTLPAQLGNILRLIHPPHPLLLHKRPLMRRLEPFLKSRRPNRLQVHLQLVLPPASKVFGAIRIRSSLRFAPYSCKLSIVPRITLSYCRLCMVQAKFVIIRSYLTYSSMRIRNSLSFTSSAITADVDTCFFLDWF